jgi:hypothetical protein
MSGDITPYLDLITSEHRDKPRFIATISATLQPMADAQAVLATIPGLFDLDVAVGSQLDEVGEWVGQTRYLSTPLTGVYFSFDTAGLGFDQGVWQGPFDPSTGVVALQDEPYRTLLRAVIAANHWDGTIPSAYAAWNIIFAGTGYSILIQDFGDMTMLFGLIGPTLDSVTKALLTGGYLTLKPSGVKIAGYVIPSVEGAPLFGFDVDNPTISGFDTGAWSTNLPPT